MLRIVRVLTAALLVVAAPADAMWLQATSAHFVIYSDTREVALREQAVELERLDAMLRFFHTTHENADAVYNKVTIYVVPSVDTIRTLSHDNGVAGFYLPRVTGSVAFTPRVTGSQDSTFTPRVVLYHEYAHHFLLGNYGVAYPAWFSEGYAEFASTAAKRNGYYWLGAAANHRAYGLFQGQGLSARQLFDPPKRMTDEQIDALYGRGWLLTHYVLFNLVQGGERGKQFTTFVALFNKGVPALKAAEQAFGDLRVLDREMNRYLEKSKIPAIRLEPERLGDPQVAVRALTPGEAAMIDFRIRSTAGVNGKTAPALYARAAPVAARFPTDATAQGWFAEIALDAKQEAAADKAADAALAANPTSSQALLYKARVLMHRAISTKSGAGSTEAAALWKEARQYIVRANRANTNDAAALALFYQSFVLEGATPRDSAKRGLYRALALVPQDEELRFVSARQLILDGEIDAARVALRPLAADPHAGVDNPAARLLAALDMGKTGQAALDAIAAPDAKAATAPAPVQ